jgi:hypothetical protein
MQLVAWRWVVADSTREPLWRVLYEAYDRSKAPDDAEYWDDHDGCAAELRYAAELRAIAEELPARVAFWGEGDSAIQALLRDEADRAEAGE